MKVVPKLSITVKRMPIKGSLQKIKKKLHDKLSVGWRIAARDFTRVVFSAVKVDTGMTRGSLMTLQKLLTRPSLPFFTGIRTGAKGYQLLSGKFIAKKPKDVRQGDRLHKQIAVNKRPLLYGSAAVPKYQFRFQINIWQWAENEDVWNAIEKGEEAFRQTVKREWQNRQPKYIDFMFDNRSVKIV